MFSNFVITALRNLLRHRMYAVINIGGLALGLAACLLIMLFVRSELGYDSWIPNAGQIHRLHTTANIPGRDPLRTVASSGQMARALKETFPEIEASTRVLYAGQRIFLDGNVYEESVTEVDPTFFQVFDLPLLQGDRNTALNDHNSIIISERTAQKYFGEEEALGQTITMCCYGPDSVNIDFRVTGLIADTPTNTHFYLDAVILIDENRYRHMPYIYESWTSLNNYTYLKFTDGSDPDGVAERLDWYLDEVMPKIVHGDHVVPPNSVLFDLFLMPIEDIHLNAAEQASSMSDIRPLGNMKLVVSFMLIALLILGIATINFLNLTTARFINRAREVSMRKVLGANRSEVVLQFLGETVLTSLLALGLSLLVVTLVLPWFNDFHSTQLKMDLLSGNGNLLMLLAITLVTGVLGGCYPSFYISRMQPAKVFRSANSAQQGRPGLFKNTLIVFQFSISIALLTITAVTWFQPMTTDTFLARRATWIWLKAAELQASR